ncbi:MAG: bis(5'-nucleosyl)-tetraphosphatase (symmetrical) [Bradymonadia bacterium]|jgi:bis(5'-nucleosyl)-tetraphosphatase (symmetrical)
MATWAIGDIQGCDAEFKAILKQIHRNRPDDRLVLVGDVVNRGPASLKALRRAKRSANLTVIGNHEVHLLAVAAGIRTTKKADTLDDILGAPDRADLIDWIRHLPVTSTIAGWRVVHAGLLPEWSDDDIELWAARIEAKLRSDRYVDFLVDTFGKTPSPEAAAFQVFTRIRMVDADGKPDFRFKGGPPDAPSWLRPWFEARASKMPVVFGHWAALGFTQGADWMSLDTGCVWGRELTAVCLETGERVAVTRSF